MAPTKSSRLRNSRHALSQLKNLPSSTTNTAYPQIYAQAQAHAYSYDHLLPAYYVSSAANQTFPESSGQPSTGEVVLKKASSDTDDGKYRIKLFQDLAEILKRKSEEDEALRNFAENIIKCKASSKPKKTRCKEKDALKKYFAAIVKPRISCHKTSTQPQKKKFTKSDNKKSKMSEILKKNHLLSLENRLLYEMVIRNKLEASKVSKTSGKNNPTAPCLTPIIHLYQPPIPPCPPPPPMQSQCQDFPDHKLNKSARCNVDLCGPNNANSRYTKFDLCNSSCINNKFKTANQSAPKQIVYMLEKESTRCGIPCYRVVLTSPYRSYKDMHIYAANNTHGNATNPAACGLLSDNAKLNSANKKVPVEEIDSKATCEPTTASADKHIATANPTATLPKTSNEKCYIIQKPPNRIVPNQTDNSRACDPALDQKPNDVIQQNKIQNRKLPLIMHNNLAKKIERGQTFVICQSVPCSTESCCSLFADVASLIESVVVKNSPNHKNQCKQGDPFQMFQSQQLQPNYSNLPKLCNNNECTNPCVLLNCGPQCENLMGPSSSEKVSCTTQTDQLCSPFNTCNQSLNETETICRWCMKKLCKHQLHRPYFKFSRSPLWSSSSSSSSSNSSSACLTFHSSSYESSDSCERTCRAKKKKHKVANTIPETTQAPTDFLAPYYPPPNVEPYGYNAYSQDGYPPQTYPEPPYPPYPNDPYYLQELPYQDESANQIEKKGRVFDKNVFRRHSSKYVFVIV
ncbi:hypothetical protein HELRODRAFT_167424 [Helobdella robusta]|uniref:Uncharacterized protein n=1 Tax=Helobdella robusta TaxID=6412 RepID=T1EZC7_HELRO|nr:hypothetical protein HELRODRAFT_167424 [Helobdella robusta]ESO10912.1 hypothetical protein HELRODRAFT_167424 [Helobdella robusta]